METKKDELLMLMSCKQMKDDQWKRNQCYIGVSVRLWWLCPTPLRHCSGEGATRSPPFFGAPRGPLCLCVLLFPLHAQTPSPPRCARRGQGQLQASQATPGSPQPWHSTGGRVNPTGSGLDLQKEEKKMQAHTEISATERAESLLS